VDEELVQISVSRSLIIFILQAPSSAGKNAAVSYITLVHFRKTKRNINTISNYKNVFPVHMAHTRNLNPGGTDFTTVFN
jgi:hypothetical protein